MCNKGPNPSQLSQYRIAEYPSYISSPSYVTDRTSWIQMIFLHVFLLISGSQSRRLACTFPCADGELLSATCRCVGELVKHGLGFGGKRLTFIFETDIHHLATFVS